MRYPRIITRFPISRRLLLIVWPFLAIVFMLVLLGIGSVDILSSVRAYVGWREPLVQGAEGCGLLPEQLRAHAAPRTTTADSRKPSPCRSAIASRAKSWKSPSPTSQSARARLCRWQEPRRRHSGHDPVVPRVPQRELHRPGDRDLGGGRSQHHRVGRRGRRTAPADRCRRRAVRNCGRCSTASTKSMPP